MDLTVGQLQVGLGTSLAVTVLLLVVAVWFAHKHQVKQHIIFIAIFLVAFVVTVAFAEGLGRQYVFHHISYPIHLSIAIFTTFFTLVPLLSGFFHLKGKTQRVTHVRIAGAWAVCIVLALVTGFWMVSEGTLKSEARGAGEIAPVTSKQ
jgi:hypothetical protein